MKKIIMRVEKLCVVVVYRYKCGKKKKKKRLLSLPICNICNGVVIDRTKSQGFNHVKLALCAPIYDIIPFFMLLLYIHKSIPSRKNKNHTTAPTIILLCTIKHGYFVVHTKKKHASVTFFHINFPIYKLPFYLFMQKKLIEVDKLC